MVYCVVGCSTPQGLFANFNHVCVEYLRGVTIDVVVLSPCLSTVPEFPEFGDVLVGMFRAAY